MTVSEVVNIWREDKAIFVKESTMSAYLYIVRKYVLPQYGNIDIREITNDVLQNLAIATLERGVSKKTMIDAAIVFKMIQNFAVKIGEATPIQFKIRYPTYSNRKRDDLAVYTESEQKKIINYILENTTFDNLGVLICLCTGLRIGEICALKWDDIDIVNKCINISKTLQRITVFNEDIGRSATKIITESAKTENSHRSVPIAKDLINILKNYKKIINGQYYVITGTKKTWEPSVYRNHYKLLILEEIKLGRCIHFHGLRHSFASRMIASGVDVKTTSKILGHSKVSITMDLYVHPTSENKIDAVNKSMRNLFK